MTVNEFIEHLKSLGDEKWRDMATVQIIHDVVCQKYGELDVTTESESLDMFDVKGGINSVDIYIEEEY